VNRPWRRCSVLRSAPLVVSPALVCLLLATQLTSSRAGQEADESAGFAGAVRAIADAEGPWFLGALPRGKAVIEQHRLAEIPEQLVGSAAAWIRKVVAAKWLPDGWGKGVFALKDWRTLERRDTEGVVFSSWEGDYLCWEYKIGDYQVLIMEDGLALSLRVVFREGKDIAADPDAFVKESILLFLNVPEDYSTQVRIRLGEKNGVYYGRAFIGEEDAASRALTEGRPIKRWWWEEMVVLTNGTVFFVAVPELDGMELSPRATPGLPDRF
jgi:hypothetical protein